MEVEKRAFNLKILMPVDKLGKPCYNTVNFIAALAETVCA